MNTPTGSPESQGSLKQRSPDTPLVPDHLVTQAQVNVLESLVEQAAVICGQAGVSPSGPLADQVLSVLLQTHTREVEVRETENSQEYQRMRAQQNIGYGLNAVPPMLRNFKL